MKNSNPNCRAILATYFYNLTNNCDNYSWHLTYWYCYYGNESVITIVTCTLTFCLTCMPQARLNIPSCPCYNYYATLL